jgi:hypothetical protein
MFKFCIFNSIYEMYVCFSWRLESSQKDWRFTCTYKYPPFSLGEETRVLPQALQDESCEIKKTKGIQDLVFVCVDMCVFVAQVIYDRVQYWESEDVSIPDPITTGTPSNCLLSNKRSD